MSKLSFNSGFLQSPSQIEQKCTKVDIIGTNGCKIGRLNRDLTIHCNALEYAKHSTYIYFLLEWNTCTQIDFNEYDYINIQNLRVYLYKTHSTRKLYINIKKKHYKLLTIPVSRKKWRSLTLKHFKTFDIFILIQSSFDKIK